MHGWRVPVAPRGLPFESLLRERVVDVRLRTWILLGLASALVGLNLVLATRTPEERLISPYYRWSTPRDALRVAWVGNSHTYVHQVPYQVQALADAEGAPVQIDVVVGPNATLAEHREAGRFDALLRGGGYDAVVLQEHSAGMLYQHDESRIDIRHYAELARAGGAQVLLVEAWPYAPPAQPNPDLGKAVELGESTFAFLQDLSREFDGRVIPVGHAFLTTRQVSGMPQVLSMDGNHTAPEGAYLFAEIATLMLLDRDVLTGPLLEDGPIAPEARRTLRKLAGETIAWLRARESPRATADPRARGLRASEASAP